ncbi:MAG: GNAT family N-acetyltransferase [Crenarchaeota archaeon]|nr:GNAT family N-acetyltransferase [Thermoproteota archaeon]
MIVELGKASEIVREIARLARESPFHSYLLHSAVYDPRSVAWLHVSRDGRIEGYALLCKRLRGLHAHFWGSLPEDVLRGLANHLRGHPSVILHVHSSELEDRVARLAKSLFRTVIDDELVELAVDRASLSPITVASTCIRALDPFSGSDAAAFAALEKERGVELSIDAARDELLEQLCFGAFVNGELASIACSLARTRYAWIVEDVFTRDRYRGMGLGSAVLHKLARAGVEAGALVAAAVRASCPARRMYRRLGFREIGSRKVFIGSI